MIDFHASVALLDDALEQAQRSFAADAASGRRVSLRRGSWLQPIRGKRILEVVIVVGATEVSYSLAFRSDRQAAAEALVGRVARRRPSAILSILQRIER